MPFAGGLLVATALATTAAIWSPSATPGLRLASLVAAFVSCGALVWREHRRPTLTTRTLLVASGLVVVAAIAKSPHGSHDLWSYAMYARILVHYRHNPYVQVPAAFPGDPILAHVSPGWRHTGSMYGPGFTTLSAAIACAAQASPVATRLAFQSLSGAGLLVGAIAVARAGAPAWAVAAIAMNPLMLVTIVNGGHIDPVIAALLLASALAVDRGRWALGAVAMAAAVSIKVVMVLPAAALVAWIARRHGVRVATLTGILALGPTALGLALFGGLKTIRPLRSGSRQFSRASLWALLRHVPVLGPHFGIAALATVAAVTAGLVVDRLHASSSRDAIAAGVLGYVLAAAYVLPWYLVWVLPLIAVGTQRWRRLAGLFVYSAALALAFELGRTARSSAVGVALRADIVLIQVGVLAGSAWALWRGAIGLLRRYPNSYSTPDCMLPPADGPPPGR